MNTFVVRFDIDEDDVNLLDTTAVDLGEFGPSSPALVRVPIRAEVWRDAGDAYTVTPVSGSVRSDSVTEFDNMFSEIKGLFPAMELWVSGRDSRGERGRILFRIPTALLENPLACGFVVMPEPGQSYVGGTFGLSIEAGTTISGGTGDIHGLLYFEEYALPL